MRLSSWLAPLLILPALAFADGKVYRWTDASGQINFSQTPPPEVGNPYDVIQGTGARALTPGGGGSGTASAASEDRRSRDQKFIENAESERKAKTEAKAKEKTAREEAKLKCSAAREQASFLEERTARRLVTMADDGNYGRMPEDDFLKRLDAAKKEVSANCKGSGG